MTDNRFPSLGVDARFPSPGVDAYYVTPGVDERFPAPGQDGRFQVLSPITATLAPATSALVVGQSLDDTTNWATFLNTANYASSAGTIVSAVPGFTGASVPDATTAFADLDTNRFAIVVTDSEGNVRTFNAGSRTVRHVAPVAGFLEPVIETQGTGTPTVSLSLGFTGQALVYTSNQPWATVSVSGSTLTIADEVRTGIVRITATNSGGSVFVDLSVTIAPAQVAPTVSASDSLIGRVLTISVDSATGNPAPSLALASLTLGGVSILGDQTGTGPWQYVVPSSESVQTVGWTITAENSIATAAVSGSVIIPADLSTPSQAPAALFEPNADGTATLVSFTPATTPIFESLPNGTARRIT